MKMAILDSKHLTIADVTCVQCNMIATLYEWQLCEFCRRPKAPERYGLIRRISDALGRWRQKTVSIVK